MAKDDPETRPKKATGETPFQKFERLARRVVRVPKGKARDSKRVSHE